MELLPCPFCGGEGYTAEVADESAWAVYCKQCGASTGWMSIDETECIEAWNQRQPGDEQEEG